MNIELSSLGPLVSLSVTGASLIAGYVTLRITAATNERRTENLTQRADASDRAHTELRLHIAETYTRKDDLRETEDRLVKRMDVTDHQIRQLPQQIVSLMSGTGPRRRASGAAD